ncbi:hypothetical protein MTAB308_5354 [Mycobacterium terramassiliense]|jgi:hypothetical protein|uniref:Uncharacterized protein n=1 Tax=Mycobacterium terramassiliense TaxID=1841859 RepID=A0A2U3NJW1_9MYCO|nr:hypothetical protein MTAB308_5354 [Mycobacterium terramassiliense]
MSSIVTRLALATILFFPIAGVLATPATAEPAITPCVSTGEIADPTGLILPPQDAPTTSCDSQKQACMSASVQVGIYGERYVPPDAVAQCMEAYRDCIHNQSQNGGQG